MQHLQLSLIKSRKQQLCCYFKTVVSFKQRKNTYSKEKPICFIHASKPGILILTLESSVLIIKNFISLIGKIQIFNIFFKSPCISRVS